MIENFVSARLPGTDKDAVFNLADSLMLVHAIDVFTLPLLLRKPESVSNLAIVGSLLCEDLSVVGVNLELLDRSNEQVLFLLITLFAVIEARFRGDRASCLLTFHTVSFFYSFEHALLVGVDFLNLCAKHFLIHWANTRVVLVALTTLLSVFVLLIRVCLCLSLVAQALTNLLVDRCKGRLLNFSSQDVISLSSRWHRVTDVHAQSIQSQVYH